jgi:hypothetical protein
VTLIYLIRREGNLEIYTDHHLIGLFPTKVWNDIFKELTLEVIRIKLMDLYAPFIVGEGEYPLQMFVCTRSA